jgi:hypothetical protein
MKRAIAILLAVALIGCTESIVLPVDETLSHVEIVGRLKKILNDEVVLSYGQTMLFGGGEEERISPTKSRLLYQHSTPQPPPSLYTPAVSYDWTLLDIDTSQKGEVRISVKTYRRGNLINDRQHEVESQILRNLSNLKERANKSLQLKTKKVLGKFLEKTRTLEMAMKNG